MQILNHSFEIDQYNPIDFNYYMFFKKALKESKGNQKVFNTLMQRYREEFLKNKISEGENK